MARRKKPPVKFCVKKFLTFHSTDDVLKKLSTKKDLLSWLVRLNLVDQMEADNMTSTTRPILADMICSYRIKVGREAPIPSQILKVHVVNLDEKQFTVWCDLFGCPVNTIEGLCDCIVQLGYHVHEGQHPELPSGYPETIIAAREFDVEHGFEGIRETQQDGNEMDDLPDDVKGGVQEDEGDDAEVSPVIIMHLCQLSLVSNNYYVSVSIITCFD